MKASWIAAVAMGAALALGNVTSAAADGDAAKGKRVFAKCAACHKLEEGKKGIGPNLHGLFGRTAGTLEGFSYSKDLKTAGEKGLVWKDDTFLAYIADPKVYIGSRIGKKRANTKMAFAGVKKEDQREDLLAYLKGATK